MEFDGHAFSEGEKRAWRTILEICLKNLNIQEGDETLPKDNGEALLECKKRLMEIKAIYGKERLEAIAALRTVCEEFGDNEWPDDLWLSDVIEKHLLPYLRDNFNWR